jgi:NhaP-type Na+/H+ or K+/H+ antiporter
VSSVVLFAGAVLLWVLFSQRLEGWSITAPIVLTTAGFVAAHALGGGDNLASEGIRELIEITLALVLFVDASSIAVRWFRTEWQYPARLLGIGLPLTIVLGTVTAAVLFPGNDIWLMAVVGASLAPTDAALGVAIIENERIPLRLRQVINVESGLNDGLVTPIVSFCIAIAAATADQVADRPFISALREIAIGVAIGFVIGVVTGRVLIHAREKRWAVPSLLPVAPFVIAVVTYLAVVAVGGNGFVAAFVCGVGFGVPTRRAAAAAAVTPAPAPGPDDDLLEFDHRAAALLGYAVWFVFGESVLGSLTTDHIGVALVYAVLSLTVLRMLPVAVAAFGLHLPRDTVLLVGWLGPRGLASIIFAILAADAIGGEAGKLVLTIIATTVAMSVLAHGLSAGPLAAWYSKRHPVEASGEPTSG